MPVKKTHVLKSAMSGDSVCKPLAEGWAWQPPADRPFPILAWLGPPQEIVSDRVVADMAAAGFNLWHMQGQPFYTEATIQKPLELARKYGIGLLVRDTRMIREPWLKPPLFPTDAGIRGAAERWKTEPAVAGYAIQDEPLGSAFEELAAIRKTLARHDPGRLVYVNLFPSYAGRKRLGGSFSEYVDRFIETFKPAVLSYDHYCVFKDSVRASYYADMEIIRAAALRAQIPFWAFTLSIEHFNYARPTEGHLRFQLYSDLAYGAKGLQCFTYGSVNNWKHALIDKAGNRSDTWAMAANVNREIQNMGPVLLDLTSTEVLHTAPCPSGTREFKGHGGVAACTGGPAVLGFFENPKGEKWLMVVNRSPFKSADLTISFSDEVASVDEVDRTKRGGVTRPVVMKDRNVTLSMPIGDGRLFRINAADREVKGQK